MLALLQPTEAQNEVHKDPSQAPGPAEWAAAMKYNAPAFGWFERCGKGQLTKMLTRKRLYANAYLYANHSWKTEKHSRALYLLLALLYIIYHIIYIYIM